MKILVICPVFPNVSEDYINGLFIKEQLTYLSKKVERISVICPITVSFRYTEQDKKCDNYTFGNVDVYFPRYTKVPLKLFSRFIGPIQFLFVNRMIKKYKIDFDIIHSHFTWPSGHLGKIIGKSYKVPTILTVHENQQWFLEESLSNNKYIIDTWSKTDHLIRVNGADITILSKFNSKATNVPNGFDPTKYYYYSTSEARKKLNLPPDKKIIFSLGALIKRKGYSDLINAMEVVVEENKSVYCYIGGVGPEHSSLEDLIIKKNMADHIKLIGFVPTNALNDWLNACDFYIQPSLSESFGVVQLCSMAVGKPVIATKNGGSEELIISDDYGLICQAGNPASLGQAILSSLTISWNHPKIIEYANTMTWEKIVELIINIYESELVG